MCSALESWIENAMREIDVDDPASSSPYLYDAILTVKALKSALEDLKHFNNHTIDEELWRIEKALAIDPNQIQK